jgi:hypothetical protein
VRAFWVCRFALWGAAVLALAACASLPRDPVTPELESQVSVLENVQVRYWGDRAPDNMAALAAEKLAQVKSPRPLLAKAGGRPRSPVSMPGDASRFRPEASMPGELVHVGEFCVTRGCPVAL